MPNPRLHIAYGFGGIIETVRWGLANLGLEVSYAINRAHSRATNIVFGASMLGLPALSALPENTIIYNLEQMSGLDPADINERVKYCADRFPIWDYSEFNLPTWRALNPNACVRHVPIGYAPILTRIDRAVEQDIDVLLYGGPGGPRLQVYADVCERLLKAVFVICIDRFGPT